MKKAFETPAIEVLRLEVADSLTNETNNPSMVYEEGVFDWNTK